MRSPRLLLILLLAACQAKGPPPLDAKALDQRVRSMLNPHEAPPDRSAFVALGPGAGTILLQIVTDASVDNTHRALAAEALGWFGTSESVAVLQNAMLNHSLPTPVRASAVTGLSRALPQDDAVAAVTPALTDNDEPVRYRAVLALQELGGPTASATLAQQLHHEAAPQVLRALTHPGEKPSQHSRGRIQ